MQVGDQCGSSVALTEPQGVEWPADAAHMLGGGLWAKRGSDWAMQGDLGIGDRMHCMHRGRRRFALRQLQPKRLTPACGSCWQSWLAFCFCCGLLVNMPPLAQYEAWQQHDF